MNFSLLQEIKTIDLLEGVLYPIFVALAAPIPDRPHLIINLIKNSFEAMPSGGAVLIETTLENDKTKIIFTDTGCGIEDDNPENIFLPFYSTKKGSNENIGLGLSVSYGIIKKYNGSILVRNLADGGCVFTIELPYLVET